MKLDANLDNTVTCLMRFMSHEDSQDRKADAIYAEANRLVDQEISEVLHAIYCNPTALERFESAVKTISQAFSTKHSMLAADDIQDLVHTTAMQMAEKEYNNG